MVDQIDNKSREKQEISQNQEGNESTEPVQASSAEDLTKPTLKEKPDTTETSKELAQSKKAEEYDKKTKEIPTETTKEDLRKVKDMDPKDLRNGDRKLETSDAKSPEEEIKYLKDEQARRLLCFADKNSDGSYTLNYQKYEKIDNPEAVALSEKFENGLGIQDVICDVEVDELEITTPQGETFLVKRNLASNGRLAFCYTNQDGTVTNRYFVTYTGYKVKILSNNEIASKEEYVKKIKEDKESRKKYEEKVIKYKTSENPEVTIDFKREIANRSISPTPDSYIESQLNKTGLNPKEFLAYCENACNKFDVPFEVYKELVKAESGWNYMAKNREDPRYAWGLGQFLPGSWEGFVEYCQKNNIHDPKWKSDPPDRLDPYANAYATAYNLGKVVTKLGRENAKNKPLDELAILMALKHHEGSGGMNTYLRMMDRFKQDGCSTKLECIEKYNNNPDRYLSVLVASQPNRMRANPSKFLDVYFKYARGIAIRACAGRQEIVSQYQSEVKQEDQNIKLDYQNIETRPDSPRNKLGNQEQPYRFLMNNKYGFGTSGCPGIIHPSSKENPEYRNFDFQMAYNQVKNLYLTNGITTVVSFANQEKIRPVIQKLNEDGIPVKHLQRKFDTEKLTQNDINIFEELGELNKRGIKYLSHCVHGAHRAIAAATGALIASGKCKTFDEAFKAAGGEKERYAKQKDFFRVLIKYAETKGIPIEDEYKNFVA